MLGLTMTMEEVTPQVEMLPLSQWGKLELHSIEQLQRDLKQNEELINFYFLQKITASNDKDKEHWEREIEFGNRHRKKVCAELERRGVPVA